MTKEAFGGGKGIDFSEFYCTLATLCGGTAADKISFIFDVIDLNGDGLITSAEFSKFVHGVANIRAALQQWSTVKSQLPSDGLRRAASGAVDPVVQILGGFSERDCRPASTHSTPPNAF